MSWNHRAKSEIITGSQWSGLQKTPFLALEVALLQIPLGKVGPSGPKTNSLGSFSKHFFYCNDSSINFRLQDSELQALCGTRSRVKSQDLLCTTGINASIRHIILTIKYCRSIPAPQWSCSSFASHHPTPIPLEPVNSYLKNPKRMVWHLKLQHIFQENAKQWSS